MANQIENLRFEQKHGKDRVRVARVWRNRDGHHFFVEWSVSISLLSDCIAAYTRDDNSDIVATDTMKNTVSLLLSLGFIFVLVYCWTDVKINVLVIRFIFNIRFDLVALQVYSKAKECVEQLSVEDFAVKLAKHFTSVYQQVNKCCLNSIFWLNNSLHLSLLVLYNCC